MEVGTTIGIILFVLIFLGLYFGLLAYAVIAYILGCKGMYAIAARRGIKNPWMAWVPIVSNWTLGCLSDQYATGKYGQDPNLRKKLLILSIITQSGAISTPVFGSFNLRLNFGDRLSMPELPEGMRIALIVLLVLMVMFCIAVAVLSVIQTVYQFKAYYNLYASCRPEKAVLFLVLSILTPAGPFLIYSCRDSDEGMPPEQAPAPESLQ